MISHWKSAQRQSDKPAETTCRKAKELNGIISPRQTPRKSFIRAADTVSKPPLIFSRKSALRNNAVRVSQNNLSGNSHIRAFGAFSVK